MFMYPMLILIACIFRRAVAGHAPGRLCGEPVRHCEWFGCVLSDWLLGRKRWVCGRSRSVVVCAIVFVHYLVMLCW